MANDVWQFKTLSNGKTELVGRLAPNDVDPAKLPGATHDINHQEHTLVVRSDTDFAERCRTCDTTGLVKGQLCEMIDKYNDEKHPL